MKIGSLASPVQVTNTWTVAYDSGELSAAATSLTISNINGDIDEEYQLILREVSGVTTTQFQVRPNNDSAANYGWQRINGQNMGASAYRTTDDRFIASTYGGAVNEITLSVSHIYAKSGYVRTALANHASGISGTTVTNITSIGSSWNNTSDVITNLVVLANQTNGIGIGSRIILLKKVTSTSGMKTGALEVQGSVYGTWQKVYSTTLDAAATSVTISGLDGNTDVMYRLKCRLIFGGAGGGSFFIRPNNDTGTNYGEQQLTGVNTTASASRSTARDAMYIDTVGSSVNNITQSEEIIYAKSGYVRTEILIANHDVSGTTNTRIELFGHVWNNTTDNITSLVVGGGQANSLGIGTFIYLEKLVLS